MLLETKRKSVLCFVQVTFVEGKWPMVAGADINYEDEARQTPLHWAAARVCLMVLKS